MRVVLDTDVVVAGLRSPNGAPVRGRVGRFLDLLCRVGQPLQISFLWRPTLRDPGDEMVLEAAVGGRADRLLTFNLRDFAGSERLAGRDDRAARTGVAALEGRPDVTQANYALRLQAGLKAEAERVAKAEGTTLNQFINVAVAEKLSALRTAEYFRERAARADLDEAFALLESFGDPDAPLQAGDEPEGEGEPAGTTRG